MPTPVSADALALQRLYHWERTAPDRVVLTQPLGQGVVRDYTWRAVMDQSRRMAAHLQSLGLQPGDRVALLAYNCVEWMEMYTALAQAGLVAVPVNFRLTPPEIAYIVEHSEALFRSALAHGRKDDGVDLAARLRGRPGQACRAGRRRRRRRPKPRGGATARRARTPRPPSHRSPTERPRA